MNKDHDLIWDDLPKKIQKGNFLPGEHAQYKFTSWDGEYSGTDTETTYQKNLLKQPKDWYYRDNPINYKKNTNTHGYRTQEFADIDWANSVVIFGCSMVYGVGVHEEDTLSSQLSKLINMPVINMGVGGTSMEYSLYNSIILSNRYPTPKAVVQIWSSYTRATYYNTHHAEHYGSWNMQKNNFIDVSSKDPSHGKVHAVMAQLISKQLWRDTKYYESSFFNETSELLFLKTMPILDYARDMSHPGRLTLERYAKMIKDGLEL
jgi:hypothetical protein